MKYPATKVPMSKTVLSAWPRTMSSTAAVLCMALGLSALPAQAQRGDRGESIQQADRGQGSRGSERGEGRGDRADRQRGREHAGRGEPDWRGAGRAHAERRDGYDRGHRGEHWRGNVIVRPVPVVRPGFRPGIRPIYGAPVYRPISRHYPRHGLVIRHRPALWTWITVGTLAYLYADGVYYREHRSGGYEVVAPPPQAVTYEAPAAAAYVVYARQGQSAERQATDEYECHRWAVQQTGFDPSSVAAGTASDPQVEQLSGYPLARNGCLDARGYTVR